MKKCLMTMVCLVTFFSTDAFATKARMNALGQSTDTGSFYVRDTRNIFYNPAYLNMTNDYVIFEWNSTATTGTSSDGEGGYFKKGSSFNYGVYMGADIDSRTQNVARNANSFTKSDDMIDLFLITISLIPVSPGMNGTIIMS